MPRARAQDLLLVSKSHKKTIDLFKAGASLEERTGYEIGALPGTAEGAALKLLAREAFREK